MEISIEALVDANTMPWDRAAVLASILRHPELTTAEASREAMLEFESNDDADSADRARACLAIYKSVR